MEIPSTEKPVCADVDPPTLTFPWLSEVTLGFVARAASGLLETARELIGSVLISTLLSMAERVAFSVLINTASLATSMLCAEEANLRVTSKRNVCRASNCAAVTLYSANPAAATASS